MSKILDNQTASAIGLDSKRRESDEGENLQYPLQKEESSLQTLSLPIKLSQESLLSQKYAQRVQQQFMTLNSDEKLNTTAEPITLIEYQSDKEVEIKIDENVPPSQSSNSPECARLSIARNRGNPELGCLPL